jgi:hypothetical protein
MFLRSELPTPAMRAGWQMRPAERLRVEVFGILRSPDLPVVIVFCAIGLLASVCLALSFPVADDISAFLAQVS